MPTSVHEVWAALALGAVSSVGLLVGVIAGAFSRIPHRRISIAMSVGAGLLLAGVSLKVTVDAIRLAGPIAVALSLLLGAAAFSASNALLARFGAPARWRRRRPKQQLMGHAKVDTTLNVYAQVIDGSLRRAADTVGSELVTIVPNRKMMMAGASMVMGLPSRSS